MTAYLRRLRGVGVPVYMLRKGDATAGAVIVKVARLDGTAVVFDRHYGLEGESVWAEAASGDEREADAYVARRLEGDPDLWAVEIESRDGVHLLDKSGL